MENAVLTTSEILGNSFANMQSDILTTISTALPYALAVVGTILAITVGVKLFKKFSK